MGLLKGRGTLDPRFFRAGTPVFEGDMTALIEVIRSSPEGSQPAWVEDETYEYGGYWQDHGALVLWRGMARVTPNKDWRARNRTWAMEQTAEHAVRIQMNLYKNFLVPREEWPAPPVDIWHGDIVKIVKNPNDPVLEKYSLAVRNAIGASDNWHRTLLCDANLGGRYGEGG